MSNQGRNKKKLAIIIRNFSAHAGGAERYCFELTLELRKLYEVHVFCQDYSEKIDEVKFYKVPKIKKPRFLNQILFSFATYLYSRKQNFEIIHSHDMVTFANVYSIHVETIKSGILKNKGVFKKLGVFISPRLLGYLFLEKRQMSIPKNQKKAIVAVSNLNQENIVINYPNTKNFLHIVSPAISLDIKNKPSQINVLEKYQIPKNAFIIIFVGHNFRRKGLQVLINACEKIKKINPWIIVAGRDSPDSVSFSSTKSKSRTIFLGEVSDVSPFYSLANVIVHPTLGDTYGMAILEAMYYETPAIISDEKFCGIASELDESNSLKLIDPLSSSELSQKLLKLYNNRVLSSRLSKNAKIFADNKTWGKAALKFCSIYNEVI